MLSKYIFKIHEKYKEIHKFFTPICVKYDVTRHVMTLSKICFLENVLLRYDIIPAKTHFIRLNIKEIAEEREINLIQNNQKTEQKTLTFNI